MNKRQSGLSSISLLLILVAIASVMLVAFKVGPLYIDNYFVKASVDSLSDEDVEKMSDRAIRKALDRYFTINGVRDIDLKSVKIDRDSKRILVMVDYEKRVNVFGNLDVVVKFENHYDTRDK